MKIGVINWDACLPGDTYYGGYAARSLSPAEFHYRLPYYAHVVDGAAVFPERTQADFDRELTYAINAGIDYFAYCRYTSSVLEHPQDEVERTAGWRELNHACRMHRNSALRDRIGYCLILRPSKMNDSDFAALPEEMAADCYVKMDGRPLVYFFGGDKRDLYEGRVRLRAVMERAGAPEPYMVAMLGGTGEDAELADALSMYAIAPSDCGSYDALVQRTIERNLSRTAAGRGLPIVPLFSTGWNPKPRILSPVPWTSYENGEFSEAQPTEIADAFSAFLTAMQAAKISTEHILTFAWNEFEEGGWLCPTLGQDGQLDTRRLDAFAMAVRNAKKSAD